MQQVASIRVIGAVVRRRSRGEGPRVKASFTLHEDIVNAVKTAVAEGHADNASAFVEEAVAEKLRRSRRSALYAAYAEAARDPRFCEDMNEVTRAFEVTARDGLIDGN
jgi:hypothetical protein